MLVSPGLARPLDCTPDKNMTQHNSTHGSMPLPLVRLFLLHIFIIVLSNYAVQIPITVLGIETTVGTFTFPFVFVTTDLTVRLYGAQLARKVIFCLGTFSIFVFRIAAASFGAYILGQLADIFVFQKLRQLPRWWPAPAASSVFGNMLDTFAFFFIAFYQCVDPYMAENWFNLGVVDYIVKLLVCLVIFVPIYGIFLAFLSKYVFHRPLNAVGVLS